MNKATLVATVIRIIELAGNDKAGAQRAIDHLLKENGITKSAFLSETARVKALNALQPQNQRGH